MKKEKKGNILTRMLVVVQLILIVLKIFGGISCGWVVTLIPTWLPLLVFSIAMYVIQNKHK